MAKHWKIARKYEDPQTGEIVITEEKWVSVPEGRGRRDVATGLWQKVGEWDDDAPAIPSPVREISPKRSRPEKKSAKE